jgi:hypothetical protein
VRYSQRAGAAERGASSATAESDAEWNLTPVQVESCKPTTVAARRNALDS